ncbi:MAG: crotonase/enoyl-CoA hydratase family protein [Acidimicrobiales bacterium]|nr:crotonase/enoyl-CoA hydratase family protein [Acidimicrobiales bacterium]MCB1259711.1 crotonase/enoyl-CoA hydratase family protein [Acidimicrobiales bacterium]
MVELEVIGNVLVMKINRPEARNAVNADVAQGIEAGIDRLEESDDLWVGILTGTKEFFCAGADLKLINAGRAGEMMAPKGGFAGIVTRERRKPIIAAVEGPALAGGLEIALSCDMIVASQESRFGIPEVKRSLVAAAGGLFRLGRVLPKNVATELALTGDPIEADRAYDLGMVNRVSAPGFALEAALELAAQISANAPLAVQLSRELMIELKDCDDAAGIQRSNEALLGLMGSEDFGEGLTAFIEKRPPAWKGR